MMEQNHGGLMAGHLSGNWFGSSGGQVCTKTLQTTAKVVHNVQSCQGVEAH